MGFNLGDIFGGLFGGPQLPTSNKVATAETPVVDSVHPRSLCLGTGAWEQSLVWRQSHNFSTNALEPKEALTDILAIADHPTGAMTRIWLDDEVYTIGTATGSGGDDFIPALLADNWQSEIVDAGWYVANVAKFDMRDVWQQTGGDGFRRPAIMFRHYDGTQTDLTGAGGDEWLKLVPGWTDFTRVGTRTSLLAVTWRFGVNDRVTPSGRPSILIEGPGSNEIFDWRTSTTGASNNAALCFAHALMWEYFPWQRVDASWTKIRLTTSSFETAAMQAAATLCESGAATFTGNRYAVSAQLMADLDPEQIIEDFSLAMGGAKIFTRAGKIVILPGGPRTWVASFGIEDLLAHRSVLTPRRRPRRSRYNAVQPEYRAIGQGWQYTDADLVAPAAYLSDDEGRVRTKKLRFNATAGAAGKERAQRLARIWLDRHRLEDRVTLAVHALMGVDTTGNLGAGLRVEEGDIVRFTWPRRGWVNKEFEVAAKEWDAETHSVTLDLDEWSSAIDWDGTGTVPDEATEAGDFRRGGLSAPTGLAWADRPRSTLRVDGELLMDGVLRWDAHPDTLVDDIGSYRIRYRESSETDWVSTTAEGNFKALNNLRWNVEHRAAVRAALPGVESEWSTTLVFTPTSSYRPIPGGPGSGVTGSNQAVNGNFERGDDGSYDLDDETATATGSAIIDTTGGKYGPRQLEITITAASAAQFYRVRNQIYIPVSPGEWKLFRVGARRISGSVDFEARLNAIYYDGTDPPTFIIGKTPIIEPVNFSAWPESRFVGRNQVPGDSQIVWMRLQLHHQTTASGAQNSAWDGLDVHDLTVMRGERQTTQVNRTNDTWTNLASLTGFADSGSFEADIYFDGETTITVTAYVYASVQHTTATKLTQRSRAVARVRLEEVGVGTTTIVDQTMIARMWPSETDASAGDDDYGSGVSTEVEVRRLETTLTPTEGHYKVHIEGRLVGDGTNARAQFHDRWIRIAKD